MVLWFEQITSAKLQALAPETTVFFFPVGPLEDHGPHLPMGLDLMEAERLSILAAERMAKEMPDWTAVIMPKAPLGIDSHTSKTAVTVRGHVLRDWLVDGCQSLSHSGFQHFVCFSGNPGPRQLTAVEEAGKFLRKQNRKLVFGKLWNKSARVPVLVSAGSAVLGPQEASTSPFRADPREHGGERDTSVALFITPENVDPAWTSLPVKQREGTFLSRLIKYRKRNVSGYWGNPSQGSAAAGKALLAEKINELFPKLRAVWEGANPQGLFRSWFSIWPGNKSFFKAWLLAAAVMVVMIFWIFSTFQSYLHE